MPSLLKFFRRQPLPARQPGPVKASYHATRGFAPAQATAEALTLVVQKIDGAETRLTAEVRKVDTKIDGVERRLESKIGALDTKVDGVEKRLEAKIGALDAKVDKVESRLEAKIDAVGQRLSARMDRLETVMTDNHLDLNRKHNELSSKLDRLIEKLGA